MLRVCSVCESNINFSINADTDMREFAAMSSRPISRVQQRLFARATRENDVHNVQSFEPSAVLFLTDDKATLTDSEMSLSLIHIWNRADRSGSGFGSHAFCTAARQFLPHPA